MAQGGEIINLVQHALKQLDALLPFIRPAGKEHSTALRESLTTLAGVLEAVLREENEAGPSSPPPGLQTPLAVGCPTEFPSLVELYAAATGTLGKRLPQSRVARPEDLDAAASAQVRASLCTGPPNLKQINTEILQTRNGGPAQRFDDRRTHAFTLSFIFWPPRMRCLVPINLFRETSMAREKTSAQTTQ